MPDELTPSDFTRVQREVSEGDILTLVYENTNIDDQSRNPFAQAMQVTNTRGNLILGDRVDNSRRNRGLAIQCRTYGGEKKVLLVHKNYVSGMRDNHYRGPIQQILPGHVADPPAIQ